MMISSFIESGASAALTMIPCELLGKQNQSQPVSLIGIDLRNKVGFVRFSNEQPAFSVSLSTLKFAASAFEAVNQEQENSSPHEPIHTFVPRESVEVWLPAEKTPCIDSNGSSVHNNVPTGAWWPGHILSIHNQLIHVEIAAPIQSNSSIEDLESESKKTKKLPYVPAVVDIKDVRLPWTGTNSTPRIIDNKNGSPSYTSLDSQVLLHHTIYLPEQLYKIAFNPSIHLKYLCYLNAPCLISCDAEPVPLNQFMNQSEHGIPVMVIRLYIWSASSEAIRRAKLLEPIHVSLMQERYRTLAHIEMNKVTNSMSMLNLTSNNQSEQSKSNKAPSVAVSVSSPTNSIPAHNMAPSGVSSAIIPSTDGLLDTTCPNFPPPTKINWSDGNFAFRLKFQVEPHLMGYVIGARGTNISEARSIEGVHEVTVDEHLVTIIAESVDLCQQARERLDIVELEIPIDTKFVTRLKLELQNMVTECGVKKAYILQGLARFRIKKEQELEERRRLSSVVSLESSEEITIPSNADYPAMFEVEKSNWPPAVCIIGSRSSVVNMRHLVDFHVKNWQNLAELEITKRSLQEELYKIDSRPGDRYLISPNKRRAPFDGDGELGRGNSSSRGSKDVTNTGYKNRQTNPPVRTMRGNRENNQTGFSNPQRQTNN